MFDIETSKPKLFWAALVSTLMTMIVGVVAFVVRLIIDFEPLHYFLFFIVALLWLITALLLVIYYVNQMTGRYSKIQMVKLREQMW